MTAPAISIDRLSKRFGPVQALHQVSFEVPPQSIFGLLGPNGAGKTTLFSIAANFLRADSGSVAVLGVDVGRIAELLGRLTILPQDALFQRNVPILEQLTFFRLLDGKSRQEAVEEVKTTLEKVGLGKYMHRRVHSLSHGMIKRLGLAQAFLGEPEVILLDEPTSGLDPQNARQIRDLVHQLRSRATVVVSSHNLAEVQELCDHVAILDEGKLVTYGSVDEITRTGHEVDLRLSRPLSEEESRRVADLPSVSGLRLRGEKRYAVSLDLSGPDADLDLLLAELLRTLLDMNITPRAVSEGNTLEAHFLKVTGKS